MQTRLTSLGCFLFLMLFFCTFSAQADMKIRVRNFHTLTDEELAQGHYANIHGDDGVYFDQDLRQFGYEYGPKGANEVDVSESYVLDFGKPLEQYLVTPVRFMEAKKEGEACTPIKNTYQCKQGQAYTNTCFLTTAQDLGPKLNDLYRIEINEPAPLFCKEVPAVGLYDGKKNQFLVTVRYFPISQGKQSRAISSMTVLFKAKKLKTGVVDSTIELTQDDSCLGNPNRIGSIPEARKRLQQCASQTVRK